MRRFAHFCYAQRLSLRRAGSDSTHKRASMSTIEEGLENPGHCCLPGAADRDRKKRRASRVEKNGTWQADQSFRRSMRVTGRTLDITLHPNFDRTPAVPSSPKPVKAGNSTAWQGQLSEGSPPVRALGIFPRTEA